jgi:branched-chain amino acid transport system ATP-binding protein
MLSLRGLSVAYGHVEALRGIDLEALEGEVTAIIGSNGAGKTSTLMAISGLAPITGGSIFFAGKQISGAPPHDITQLGITHVLEGRQLFADQTVEDNLLLGGYTRLRGNRAGVTKLMEHEMDRFPILRNRRQQLAGTLSGGEQQMLAIARGLMSEPRLMLMDEPSMGLAPLMIQEIARTIRSLKSGCAAACRPRLRAGKRPHQNLGHGCGARPQPGRAKSVSRRMRSSDAYRIARERAAHGGG